MGKEQEVSGESDQSGKSSQGDQQHDNHQCGKPDDRSPAYDPGAGPAVGSPLAEELLEIKIELEQGLAVTAGEKGLRPVDDPEEQWGQYQGSQRCQ